MAVPGRRNGLMDDEDDFGELPEYALFEEDGLEIAPDGPHFFELHTAVVHGDIDALRLALDNLAGGGGGNGIDEPGEDGETALHLACRYGNVPCLQLLLERGASLEAKDENGAIPLHDACDSGFVDIVELILNGTSDSECVKRILEAVDRKGDTPLHYAARHGSVDVMRVLLVSGADPTRRNTSRKIPGELADPESEAERFLESAVSAVEFNSFIRSVLRNT